MDSEQKTGAIIINGVIIAKCEHINIDKEGATND